jgi:signal transduction histidine kinase
MAFDLNALVNSMRGTLDKLVEGDVELSYDLCETALPVRSDAAQIEQVLMNLVLNARQAIDDGAGSWCAPAVRIPKRRPPATRASL